ncbi:hypothetical protein [Methylocystis sp.]|uniref:hypothetical protein n=1 Tax=Methylocystis sp. TaxID=1911079 RepID=UPI0025E62585|nr:hypothetical protein [Methylocystis sp.]
MAYQRFKLPELSSGLAAVAAVHPENRQTAANAASAARGEPEIEIPAPISLEDRRASVEKIYERMAAERERRWRWWEQPVEGWREGTLTLRNIARDETVVVDFNKWKAGR